MSVSWTVKSFRSVSSTQDLLKRFAVEGVPEGAVVHALEQTKGRGRRGNGWISPPGNLYLSALLRPDCLAEQAGQLAFVVALAVSAALDGFIGSKAVKTLKWPNDVLLDGRKCAGILLETHIEQGRLRAVMVGIGVNVAVPPPGFAGVADVSGVTPDIVEVRTALLEALDRFYTLWMEEGFAPVRTLWLKQAEGLNGPVRARLPDTELEGVFTGLDESGSLVMKDERGNKRLIRAGQVFFESDA